MTRELSKYEATVFGADAEICAETGFVFECGAGSHPKHIQTAVFKRQLADREWVRQYKLRDPHARERHPHLFEGTGK